MMWDGVTERRRNPTRRETVEVPVAAVLLGFVAVIILQVSALVGHNNIREDHQADRMFEKSITCYVFKTTNGKVEATTVLADCGFFELPGGPERE